MSDSRFVVQLHDATTLHFDLRLRFGDVLRSWAVPRGPSLDPAVRRLAVPVEDHSLDAGDFEGVHQGQARGSGAVIIWDEGPADILREEPGHLSFVLHGSKLAGGFGLTRTGPRRWILVKTRDEEARPGSDVVAERAPACAPAGPGRTSPEGRCGRDRVGPGSRGRDQAAVDGEVGPGHVRGAVAGQEQHQVGHCRELGEPAGHRGASGSHRFVIN